MYQKILVPLDGSKMAECSLDEVRKLAETGWVRKVVLFSVVEIPAMSVGEGLDYAVFRKSQFDRFQKYLTGIRSRVASEGVEVVTEVSDGNAAQMISNYVKQNDMDLIVIATHGYSGMKKLIFGSVALQVLHDSDVPVLLIRPRFSRE